MSICTPCELRPFSERDWQHRIDRLTRERSLRHEERLKKPHSCRKCSEDKDQSVMVAKTKDRHCSQCGYSFRLSEQLCSECLKEMQPNPMAEETFSPCCECGDQNGWPISLCPKCSEKAYQNVMVRDKAPFCNKCWHRIRWQKMLENDQKTSPRRASGGRVQGRPQPQHKEPAGQKTWWQKVDRYTGEDYVGSDDGLVRNLASMVRGLFETVAGFMIVPLYIMGICLASLMFFLTLTGAIWLLTKVLGG